MQNVVTYLIFNLGYGNVNYSYHTILVMKAINTNHCIMQIICLHFAAANMELV